MPALRADANLARLLHLLLRVQLQPHSPELHD